MNSRVLRAILVGVLIATVAVKLRGPRAVELDVRSAVIALIAREGWSIDDEAVGSSDPLGKPINFQAQECDGLSQVFPVDLGLQLAPMVDRLIKPGYTRRFVYLERTWFAQDRFGLRLEWFKNRLLSLVGLARFVANETALVIVEPSGCRAADKINWSAVWERPN